MKRNFKGMSFFDYWESFVSEYDHNEATVNQIMGWEMPIGNYGNELPSRSYLPEPYWGWTPNNDAVLKAVFLNLNPGRGGESQCHTSNSQYITDAKKSYKSMVQNFSDIGEYNTTKWFQRKRADWISSILPDNFLNTKVSEILCADLIPWHTPKYDSQTAQYTENVKCKVRSHVICPIAKIASTAKLKDIVIAKGAHIEHLLTDIIGQPETYYNDAKTRRVSDAKTRRVSVFYLNKTRFLVFVGGQGMSLPNSNSVFRESGLATGKEYSIKEIISKQ